MAADEVLIPVSTHEALIHAQIDGMRMLSDQVGRLNQSVALLSKDMREVRDSVIKTEAQDYKGQIVDLKNGHDKRVGDLEDKFETLTTVTLPAISTQFADLRGRILPIGVLLGTLFSGVIVGVIVKFVH